MTNLPTTFDGLLALLYHFRDECTWPENKTIDYDMLAEKLDVLLDQYTAKQQPSGESGILDHGEGMESWSNP